MMRPSYPSEHTTELLGYKFSARNLFKGRRKKYILSKKKSIFAKMTYNSVESTEYLVRSTSFSSATFVLLMTHDGTLES